VLEAPAGVEQIATPAAEMFEVTCFHTNLGVKG